jgi:curved DNA-binding protein CbpA
VGDLYDVLQVHPRAVPEVVRAAHRALAGIHHPDRGGDERLMMEINSAWSILGDPVLRSEYDIERERHFTVSAVGAAAERRGDTTPPPRHKLDSSRIMDFGRYAGWSLQQLVDTDPIYLEWLTRTSIGRGFGAEIAALLAQRVTGSATKAGGSAAKSPSRPTKRKTSWWAKRAAHSGRPAAAKHEGAPAR